MKPLFPLPKLSYNELIDLRRKERAKYTKRYFEEAYWVEDFPQKKHYRQFPYNDPTHEKRFTYLTSILTKYFQFKTALDVGCGMGHVVRNLLADGYEAKGIDVSMDAIKYFMPDLSQQGIVVCAGIESLPFYDDTFDLVFSSDVMEHILIFDTNSAITELIRVARKYLVLTINLDHPYEYHPTILSRDTWERLFISTNKLKHLKKLQQRIEKETKKKYSEYDWFVFEKL